MDVLRTGRRVSLYLGLFSFLTLGFSANALPLQLVSKRDPAQAPPAGGNSDSLGSILSPDGRFILFSSSANNLVTAAGGTAMPVLNPAKLNVFLRDRTNGTTTLVSVN